LVKEIRTTEDIRQRLDGLKKSGKIGDLEREADKVEGLLLSPDNFHIALEALEELEAKIQKRDETHERELEPYRHKLDIWTRQGFDTTGLSEVMAKEEKNVKDVDKLFWRFEKMVERVVNMEKDLLMISIPEFEVEIESLRTVMTDPKRLGEFSRKYHHLVERINNFKKEAQRRRELTETIERYKDMGYKVDPLMSMVEGDLRSLEIAVSELEDSVIILQDMEQRLNNVDPSGREERVEYVRTLLYDPERLSDAMDEVESLERPQ
jgi:hypothetical protein